MNFGIIGPRTELDPLLGTQLRYFLVTQAVYSNLVQLDDASQVQPCLAADWSISSEQTKYTLRLDPEARFSDGTPITADDVLFTFNRHLEKNSRSIIKHFLLNVLRSVSVLPENRILFELKGPYLPFLQLLTMPGFAVVKNNQGKISASAFSGPFKPATLSSHPSRLVLEENPHFPKRLSRPKIKGLTIFWMQSLQEATESMRNQDIDVLFGLPPNEATHLDRFAPLGFTIEPTQSLSFAHLVANVSSPALGSIEVRRLLGQLISNSAHQQSWSPFLDSLKTLLPIGVMPPDYYARPSHPISSPRLLQKKQTEAAELALAQLRSKPVRILTGKGWIPEALSSRWKSEGEKRGIKIAILTPDREQFWELFRKGEYEYAFFGYIGNFQDPDGFLDAFQTEKEGGLRFDIQARELFENVRSVRFERNPATRLKQYTKMIRAFEEKWTVVPLFQMRIPIALRKDVVLPSTAFKYETELWRFLWKTAK